MNSKKPSLSLAYSMKRRKDQRDSAPRRDIPNNEEVQEHYDSVAEEIIAKKRKGNPNDTVDIESNGQEEPNYFDERNVEVLDENYDSVLMDMSQPEDSNLIGDDIDSDDRDMVNQIRRKLKKR